MVKRCIAAVVLLASLPLLQGAGCRSHHSAHLQGKVFYATEPADQVRVIYRQRLDGTVVCTYDWTMCMRDGTWQPLHKCNGTPSDPIIISSHTGQHQFDACTGMVGVDYEADIAAFVDANGDGKLGSGERYGVWKSNPITRDRESGPPLELQLDETLP